MTQVTMYHVDSIDALTIRVPRDRLNYRFDRNYRYQVVALAGRNLVGFWMYSPSNHTQIYSSYTMVHDRHRRQGIAKCMWLFGIDRWPQLRRIYASVGSEQGAGFLAAMSVEFWRRETSFKLVVSADSRDAKTFEEHQRKLALKVMAASRRTKLPKPKVIFP